MFFNILSTYDHDAIFYKLIDSIVGKGWGEIFHLEKKKINKTKKQEKEQSQDVL